MPTSTAEEEEVDFDLPIPTRLLASKTKRHALYKLYSENGRFFTVEYSPSNRGKCRSCKHVIAKGEIRFRHVVCGQRCFQHKATRAMDICGRWHIPCFITSQRQHPEWFTYSNPNWKPVRSLNQVLGSKALRPDDRHQLSIQLENDDESQIRDESKSKRPKHRNKVSATTEAGLAAEAEAESVLISTKILKREENGDTG